MSKIRVPPNPNYIAEVVVLLTSLGAKRSELNAGRHACDILEIKRVHRKVIDFNVDARAGRESGEEAAIEKLETRNEAVRNEDGELPLPQIFVDGRYVGDASVLQGLEDDGLLGRILRRQMCLKCHEKKAQEDMTCPKCGTVFEEVMPKSMTVMEELTHYYGSYEDEDRDEEESDSGSEAGERLSAYEAALEAPAKQASESLVVAKRPTARPTTKVAAVPSKGGVEAMPACPEEPPAAPEAAAADTAQEPAPEKPAPAPAKAAPPPPPSETVFKPPSRKASEEAPKEEEPEKLPELEGYLWKKSPNALRLRSFEKRYFVVKDMLLYWWKSKQDAATDPDRGNFASLPKGFINLTVGPVEVGMMLGNETTFSLKPANGSWEPGSIMKGDVCRAFTFDTTDSQHNREKWADVLTKHIQRANQIAPKCVDEIVAGDSFYEAVGLPAPSKGH